jgi:phage shock protein A
MQVPLSKAMATRAVQHWRAIRTLLEEMLAAPATADTTQHLQQMLSDLSTHLALDNFLSQPATQHLLNKKVTLKACTQPQRPLGSIRSLALS